MKDEHSLELNIGIPNGIILSVIGILVLLTPLFHELPPESVAIDIAAGVLLIAGGCLSLWFGLRGMRSTTISQVKRGNE